MLILLGGTGFIGKSLHKALQESTIILGKDDCDLSEPSSIDQLTQILKPTDTVVFLSTITPDKGRGLDAFIKNIKMMEHFCAVLKKMTPAHIIYLSSDAVYSLHHGLISEESPADPDNLYGVMHLSREYMLKTSTTAPIAILRATLVYGAADTHNSYGPNRMRRMAQSEGQISLFGEGEEYRDHIYIEDLVTLIGLVISHRNTGILNLVTGHSISYKDLALKTAALFETPIEITFTKRSNPIMHRHFDATLIHKTFPFFHFTPLEQGLREAYIDEYLQITGVG